jgi:two-component system cell cycle response regulator CpdR
MGRVEKNWTRTRRRFDDIERRVELVADVTPKRYSVSVWTPAAAGMLQGTFSPLAPIVYARYDKAKPCFRFTPYLPGARLMGGGTLFGWSDGTWGMSKILLAEDDSDMRRFLVKALQNAGFEVTSYDNGLSAYQRLREEPYELLLTDIVMPEMDGIELARRAAELDPDIKIMFITGFAAVALNPDSTAPKQAKVLSKPVHLRELVSEVQKMLAAA